MPQAGEPVAAQVHDEVAGEGVDVEQPGVGAVADERRPGAGVADGRGGQLEVLGAGVVQDQEPARAIGGELVLDRVLDAVPARGDHGELAAGSPAPSSQTSLVSLLELEITR